MRKKIILRTLYTILFFFTLLAVFYFNFKKEEKIITTDTISEEIEEEKYTSSNVLKNVKYAAKDTKGNQLMIEASGGEIDTSNRNIIFLTDVKASIKLTNSENILITSMFGKYNINNYDTIFSKNVIITYLDNKITGEYLDFSLERNSLIASRDVIYTNKENVLKADTITMDIRTKDIKIQMYEEKKKVNIKSN